LFPKDEVEPKTDGEPNADPLDTDLLLSLFSAGLKVVPPPKAEVKPPNALEPGDLLAAATKNGDCAFAVTSGDPNAPYPPPGLEKALGVVCKFPKAPNPLGVELAVNGDGVGLVVGVVDPNAEDGAFSSTFGVVVTARVSIGTGTSAASVVSDSLAFGVV
jgi:hypothetical protein